MGLSELQDRILLELKRARGILNQVPRVPEASDDEIAEAIEGLRRRHYLVISGAPNADSVFGMDVEEVRLLPYAAAYVRTLGK